jgi:hypothetical protein
MIREPVRLSPAGTTWSLTQVAIFRVQAFQIGRSAAIAAALSLSSRMAALWQFSGVYVDGDPLQISAEVMRTSDRRRIG